MTQPSMPAAATADQRQSLFTIIAAAGNSRSESMLAIEAARDGRSSDSSEHLQAAEESLRLAYGAQSDVVTGEIAEGAVQVDLVLVHAQNHLAMAQTTYETACELVNLYAEIHNLKAKLAA